MRKIMVSISTMRGDNHEDTVDVVVRVIRDGQLRDISYVVSKRLLYNFIDALVYLVCTALKDTGQDLITEIETSRDSLVCDILERTT